MNEKIAWLQREKNFNSKLHQLKNMLEEVVQGLSTMLSELGAIAP